MNCHNCEIVPPIQDQGTLQLLSPLASVTAEWHRLLDQHPAQTDVTERSKGLSIYYHNKEQLLPLISPLLQTLSEEEQRTARITFQGKHAEASSPILPQMLQLDVFAARLKHHHLVSLITDHSFTSHMQPIIDISSQQIFGYELLMRPAADKPAFKPYELFEVAQQTGLHSFLDRSARISAIQVSASLIPKGIKRFINFLPSSIYNPNYCLSHTFEAIERFEQDPADFVFEVVETEKITDVTHLKNIFSVYKEHGIQVALDDVGSGFSTLEVLAELKPNYVKIDRGLISGCDRDASKQQLIAQIIQTAQSFGAIVLAEGIEEKEELSFCETQGIQLAQGYLIGKPAGTPLSGNRVVL